MKFIIVFLLMQIALTTHAQFSTRFGSKLDSLNNVIKKDPILTNCKFEKLDKRLILSLSNATKISALFDDLEVANADEDIIYLYCLNSDKCIYNDASATYTNTFILAASNAENAKEIARLINECIQTFIYPSAITIRRVNKFLKQHIDSKDYSIGMLGDNIYFNYTYEGKRQTSYATIKALDKVVYKINANKLEIRCSGGGNCFATTLNQARISYFSFEHQDVKVIEKLDVMLNDVLFSESVLNEIELLDPNKLRNK